MMQLFPIIVVALVLFADGSRGVGVVRPGSDPEVRPWLAAAVAIGGVVVLLAVVRGVHAWCTHALMKRPDPRWIARAERAAMVARFLLLVLHGVALFAFGWLDAVRSVLGNVVLLDELVASLPPIIGAALLWWSSYPIERRVRDALLMRRLDAGQSVYPAAGRVAHAWQQVRHHLLVLLVPIFAIQGAVEVMEAVYGRVLPDGPEWGRGVLTIAAGLGVFVIAPWLTRLVLVVEPLKSGPVREDLEFICAAHEVRVKRMLMWRTDGTLINAAVMGLISPLRYVLLTDALIESLTREQLAAVMAHEIGHIRRHHMPWLAISLMATLILASVIVGVPLVLYDLLAGPLDGTTIVWLEGVSTLFAAVIALLAFGWVSRRYERQADTFAVQHLSKPATMRRMREVGAGAGRGAGAGAGAGTGTGTHRHTHRHTDRHMDRHTDRHMDRHMGTDMDTGVDAGKDTDSAAPPSSSLDIVRPEAIRAMSSALGAVARLNCIDPRRRSWRHGSIAWRQEYLETTAGRALHALPIDRLVSRLKTAALVVVFFGGILLIWESGGFDREPPVENELVRVGAMESTAPPGRE